MLITRQIYRPFKPKAYEQIFEFKRASSYFYLDLSGDRRVSFADIIKTSVCWYGSGKPWEASSGLPGDFLYLDNLLYGPKVGFDWTILNGRQPILGYGPPVAMAAGVLGDYYFLPSVKRYIDGGPDFDFIPQLYGPKVGSGWDDVIIGTEGFPAAITPFVGSGDPISTQAQGELGSFYVDLIAHKFYGPKSSETWEGLSARDLLEKPYIDAGGAIGSFYIDTKANLIYGPKTSTWEGLTGVNFYTSPQMSAVGSPGDYYLDHPKHLLYGPKVDRFWEGLEGFPECENLLVQGAADVDPQILQREQNFQGGYRCIPKVVTPPAYGKVKVSDDQLGFDYNPPSKYWVGKDSFSYSLVNIFGQESDAKCIYITVGL